MFATPSAQVSACRLASARARVAGSALAAWIEAESPSDEGMCVPLPCVSCALAHAVSIRSFTTWVVQLQAWLSRPASRLGNSSTEDDDQGNHEH